MPKKRRRLRAYLLSVAALFALLGLSYFAVYLWTQPPPNYTLIDQGLYLGGFVQTPPPGTQAVLNLCETPDPYQVAVGKWEPIPDAEPAPSLDWLREQVNFIAKQREAGKVVYVHCRNGASRSGMVVVAYVMSQKGWTRDQALAFVREKRPVTGPNPAFMGRLAEWEKQMQEDGQR